MFFWIESRYGGPVPVDTTGRYVIDGLPVLSLNSDHTAAAQARCGGVTQNRTPNDTRPSLMSAWPPISSVSNALLGKIRE